MTDCEVLPISVYPDEYNDMIYLLRANRMSCSCKTNTLLGDRLGSCHCIALLLIPLLLLHVLYQCGFRGGLGRHVRQLLKSWTLGQQAQTFGLTSKRSFSFLLFSLAFNTLTSLTGFALLFTPSSASSGVSSVAL